VVVTRYGDKQPPIVLNKGDEMGRFRLGSTAIVLFGKDVASWERQYREGTPTRMGTVLGRRLPKA